MIDDSWAEVVLEGTLKCQLERGLGETTITRQTLNAAQRERSLLKTGGDPAPQTRELIGGATAGRSSYTTSCRYPGGVVAGRSSYLSCRYPCGGVACGLV